MAQQPHIWTGLAQTEIDEIAQRYADACDIAWRRVEQRGLTGDDAKSEFAVMCDGIRVGMVDELSTLGCPDEHIAPTVVEIVRRGVQIAARDTSAGTA